MLTHVHHVYLLIITSTRTCALVALFLYLLGTSSTYVACIPFLELVKCPDHYQLNEIYIC